MHTLIEFFVELFGWREHPMRPSREVGHGGMFIDLREEYGTASYDEDADGERTSFMVVTTHPVTIAMMKQGPDRPQLLSRRS